MQKLGVKLFLCSVCVSHGKRIRKLDPQSEVHLPESFAQMSSLARSDGNPTKSLATVLAVPSPPAAFQTPSMGGAPTKRVSNTAKDEEAETDLKELANQLNPGLGYVDPLQLSNSNLFDQGKAATIGYLRHSEIKHGRVAMAAFVGYLVQAYGISFPWMMSISESGSPPDQWDALPPVTKIQILLFIGILEAWGESSWAFEGEGNAHYMRGGAPGKYPSFDKLPLPLPFDLYDPLKLNKGKERERLDKGLLVDINSGRLAMLGIMAFLAEAKVPGSVPFLEGLIQPYAGQPMAPFSDGDTSLPFVERMLENDPIEKVQDAMERMQDF